MSTYFIDNSNGSLTFTIRPGELDGPTGKTTNTDLRLYGLGALKWGEGADENFLKLLENFSCPNKDPNDDFFGVPYNEDHPVWPKGQDDFDKTTQGQEFTNGPGRGINTPVNGQQWFNTTDKKIYVYEKYAEPDSENIPGKWLSVASVFSGENPPNSRPEIGDIWYNTTDFMCGEAQLMIFDPNHPDAIKEEGDKKGWVSASENYLKQCGDWMSGELNMGGRDGSDPNKIRNLADATEPSDALNMRTGDSRYVNVTGDTMTGNLSMSDNRITNLGDATGPTDAVNRRTADARYINTDGNETKTGWLSVATANPDLNSHAKFTVNVELLKDYVADEMNQGAIYYGYAVYNASAGGGSVTVNYNFDSWRKKYNADTGQNISQSEFLVVAIPTFEMIRVANPNPKTPGGSVIDSPGNLGDYGFIDYNCGPGGTGGTFYPNTSNKTYIRLKLGPTGQQVNPPHRVVAYSTRGKSSVRIHFFGGPINILWKYQGVVPRA